MIATDLALTVCFPNAGNISGGGFLVYRTASGEVGSLDYREKAPLMHMRKCIWMKMEMLFLKKVHIGWTSSRCSRNSCRFSRNT